MHKITIDGLKAISPCASCPIHIFGIPKTKNDECTNCLGRIEYDRFIMSGEYSHPFIGSEKREYLGIQDTNNVIYFGGRKQRI